MISLLHASAGVGRTGTYIAIDAMLKGAKKKNTVFIQNYVQVMRKHRPYMVQNDVSEFDSFLQRMLLMIFLYSHEIERTFDREIRRCEVRIFVGNSVFCIWVNFFSHSSRTQLLLLTMMLIFKCSRSRSVE